MKWEELNHEQQIENIKSLQRRGFNQYQIAAELHTKRNVINYFCRKHNIPGWNRGGQVGNVNATQSQGGYSRNSIRRMTARAVINSGRSLNVCERCGAKDPFVPFPRHHKDRDRTNNEADNIEVLCSSCHALEHIDERGRIEESGRFHE